MASRYYQEMQESFKNNNKSREFPAHTAKVHSVAWSCDGRRLASGSFDKTASVFVLEKDRLVSRCAADVSMVASMNGSSGMFPVQRQPTTTLRDARKVLLIVVLKGSSAPEI